MKIRVQVYPGELKCPKCGAGEKAIRAFKVYDEHGAWSQCLVCAGYWEEYLTDDHKLDWCYIGEVGNQKKGWFCTRQ